MELVKLGHIELLRVLMKSFGGQFGALYIKHSALNLIKNVQTLTDLLLILSEKYFLTSAISHLISSLISACSFPILVSTTELMTRSLS